MKCKICFAEQIFFDEANVLKKYPVKYFRCPNCGFICTEEPFWLDEAYNTPVTDSDIGIIARNSYLKEVVSAILKNWFKAKATQIQYLDYGAGYGIFTRMMRDNGFNFLSFDKYCKSLFSKDFSIDFETEKQKFDLVTSFEVLEHIVDPLAELKTIFKITENLIFSTELVSFYDPPKIDDWYYYCPEHGQHISFYTLKSLELLAQKLNKKITSNDTDLHIFSTEQYNKYLLKIFSKNLIAKLYNIVNPRESLLSQDYKQVVTEYKKRDI